MRQIKKQGPYFIYVCMFILYLYFRLLNPVQYYVQDCYHDSEGNYDKNIIDKVSLEVKCSTRWVLSYPKEYDGKKVAEISYVGNCDFEDVCPYTYKVKVNENVERISIYSWHGYGSRLKLIELPDGINYFKDFSDSNYEEFSNKYDDIEIYVY